MIIDEDIYIEHFGVKGMRWGVRNERSTARQRYKQRNRERRETHKLNKYGDDRFPLTAKQRRARQERTVKRVRNGALLAFAAIQVAGAVSVGREFSRQRASSRSSGSRASTAAKGAKSVADIINAERDHQISSLRRTHTEGHIDSEQLENFLKILNKRYDRKLFEAG